LAFELGADQVQPGKNGYGQIAGLFEKNPAG
jgi:hypothetical protein